MLLYIIGPSAEGAAPFPFTVYYDNMRLTSSSAPVSAVYNISGYIRDSNGTEINAVTVTLSGLSSGTYVTGSDSYLSDGYYSFTNLSTGTYTVIPSKTDWSFSPVNRTIILSSEQSVQNFTGTYTGSAPLYNISGYIFDSSSTGVSGVTIILSGLVNSSFTTATDGYYIFTNLSTGTYVVSAGKTDWIFNPANVSVTLNSNQANAAIFGSYTGIIPLYSISGYLVDSSNKGISAATVTLSGIAGGRYVTGANGYYTFTNLTGGNYTVKPEKSNYTFVPSSKTYTPLNSNQSSQNFDGTNTAVPAPAPVVLIPVNTAKLENNLLNPRNGDKTSIIFNLSSPGHVIVRVFSLNGTLINTIMDEDVSAGQLTRYWDGSDLKDKVVSSGIYFVNIFGPDMNQTKKVCVIK